MINLAVRDDRVEVAVLGAFTLDDYHQFEEAVRYRIEFHGRIDLLFDLRDMLSYSLDVAWEELVFSRAHADDFGRIAVLADDEWVKWSMWINRAFMSADIQLYDDYDAARAWLDAATATAKMA
jgi:hypothetical protein